MGSFDRLSNQIHAWKDGWCDIDAELDRADLEPSLGATEGSPSSSQAHWATGGVDDREGDPGCDDREPEVDDEDGADAEPRFGWNDDEAARGHYPSPMGTQVPS